MPARLEPAEVITGTPFRIARPTRQTVPLIVGSPHSGCAYPSHFLSASRLDPHTIRRSEDCLVDELFAGASACGAALLAANFPRAYCDVNREPWELDPAMFSDKLPPWCNTQTPRINAGFGTIARLVSSGLPIYNDKLRFAEAEARIRSCWQPYHRALAGLISEVRGAHEHCVLLDCHSMPSDGAVPQSVRPTPHFILGDAHGTSCHPMLPLTVERFLQDSGYRVRRNDPYAGGYVTRHYGKPGQGVHTLQIEICRSLYLDQQSYMPLPEFPRIQLLMSTLLQSVADMLPTLAE